MKYSLIRYFSTADGPGFRTAVYFSGCQLAIEGKACPGCHNSVAWSKESGKDWTEELKNIVIDSIKPEYVDGLSILGGEPLSDFALKGVLDLAKECKQQVPDKEIWLWTGYILDDVLKDPAKEKLVEKILEYIDVVIDGPFDLDHKDVSANYRGSSNQRILKINHPFDKRNPYTDVTDDFQ